MRILWTEAAAQDLEDIESYIKEENPVAAIKQVLKIINAVEKNLPTMPFLGRAGRISGTREFVVAGTPFIVAYRVKENRLEVLRVLHSSRQWPHQF